MKILLVISGFGPPILEDKIKYLEHNLDILEKTRDGAEIDVKVFCYTDQKVVINSPFPIDIVYEKGIIGQFLYRHITPSSVETYDYIIISMDDIWLNQEFILSDFINERRFKWDILSPCLEDDTLHRHKHMLKNNRTGTIFHEGLELFFYIMPRESYIQYWDVFIDDPKSVWLWNVDCFLGRKGFRPYINCDVTMKHLHLGSSMNLDAYNEAYYNADKHMVPKTIFQTWVSTTDTPIPENTKEWRDSWKKYNPDFEYLLFDNNANLKLINTRFPELLSIYNSYDRDVMRSDLSRYLYMYAFGGIYVDNDFECLKSFDPVLLFIQQTTRIDGHTDTGLDIMFGKLDCKPEEFLHSIPVSLIISKKGCHFWKFVLNVITNLGIQNNNLTFEMQTGAVLIYVCIKYYTESDKSIATRIYGKDIFEGIDMSGTHSRIGYAEPEIFYPLNWEKKNSKNEIDLSRSYAVTYWQHNW